MTRQNDGYSAQTKQLFCFSINGLGLPILQAQPAQRSKPEPIQTMFYVYEIVGLGFATWYES